jgi:ribonuclease HII
VLLDGGLKAPAEWVNQQTIIKGDEKELIISLASIVAKVSRDRKMIKLSQKYPHHSLHQHKGYGTKLHYQKITEFGVLIIHRQSYLSN